jgi:hypothetical protein
LAAGALAACSSSSGDAPPPAAAQTPAPDGGSSSGDVDGGADAAPEASAKPIPPPSFPQAVSLGGPVIAKPRVQPIFFTGDSLQDQVTAFLGKLATSSYWPDVATEYGVSAIASAPPIVIDEQPPANLTDAQIQAWLAQKLADGVPGGIGAPQPETLYALFYPTTTTIDLGGGALSCQYFDGYHNELTAGGKQVSYAVMSRCSWGGGRSLLDSLTVATVHEIFEWTTDPFPMTAPAYARTDDEHWVWGTAFIGELSDLCTYVDAYGEYKPTDVGFLVQRQWSNALSKSGHMPCAPRKTSRYFVTYPEQPDTVQAPYTGARTLLTKGVSMTRGESRAIELYFYADSDPDKAWDVSVYGYDEFNSRGMGGGTTAKDFTYELEGTNGKVGDRLKLTISATKTARADIFYVVARSGQEYHLWPGLVVAK